MSATAGSGSMPNAPRTVEMSAEDYTVSTMKALAVVAAQGQHGQRPANAQQVRADSGLAALIGPPAPTASVTSAVTPGPAGPLR
ncbi:hypothetical protein ABZ636_36530 [Streptomyces sp. NPDC007251]|uniref:hypothetical protein n=1 Tax=unclassified Streptomyces TaxID=2593676 RepID=UPI0033EF71F6